MSKQLKHKNCSPILNVARAYDTSKRQNMRSNTTKNSLSPNRRVGLKRGRTECNSGNAHQHQRFPIIFVSHNIEYQTLISRASGKNLHNIVLRAVIWISIQRRWGTHRLIILANGRRTKNILVSFTYTVELNLLYLIFLVNMLFSVEMQSMRYGKKRSNIFLTNI